MNNEEDKVFIPLDHDIINEMQNQYFRNSIAIPSVALSGETKFSNYKFCDGKYFDFYQINLFSTSCNWCDICDSSLWELNGYEAYYKGTNIKVSRFCRTDLQTFYWHEPQCLDCNRDWIDRHEKNVYDKILKAREKILNWFKYYYYSPPTRRLKKGGKAYIKAKENFEKLQKLL